MIERDHINKVLAAVNIIDVVSAFVDLKKQGQGGSYVACCPFHDEKTPSFYVSESRQYYKCFGCGAGGDAINFVQSITHCTFTQALQRLAGMAGIDTTSSTHEKRANKERTKSELRETTPNVGVSISMLAAQCEMLHNYFHGSMLNQLAVILGGGSYAEQFDAGRYLDALQNYYVGMAEYGGRTFITFPRIELAQAGTLNSWRDNNYTLHCGGLKYIAYTSGTHRDKDDTSGKAPAARWQKGSNTGILFGEHLAQIESQRPANERRRIYVVESEKTALACSACFEGVFVATGGKEYLKDNAIKRLAANSIYLLADIDAFDDWRKLAAGITCCSVYLTDWRDMLPAAPPATSKADILDVLTGEV